MQYPNHFEDDPRVTYYGSVAGYDFYMTSNEEVIIQFDENDGDYMCLPLVHARRVKATHYAAAVAIWDLHISMKELA